MQDAAVDRLSRIIVDPRPGEEPEKNRRVPRVRGVLLHLRLAEGWFSFFLLALVVYSTIWSVQAKGWVANLGLLTPVTALGLLVGIIAAKQRRIPRVLIHGLVVVLAILLAFWQTVAVDFAGHATAFLANIRAWLSLAFGGGTSNDDSIFLFLILLLGFLLAYTSVWLVYRTRSPWLMLLANAVVLLLNLNYIEEGYIVFLILFLVAALMLLLRLNLYESLQRWKRQGLRCSDDLQWEFMQAGAWISLAILVCSWFLPWGYTNAQAAQIWDVENSPWVVAQNVWNRLLAVNSPANPQNHGSFASTLTLGGNPNLVDIPVFQVKTTDGTQYLMSVSYDQYDGVKNWRNNAQSVSTNPASKKVTNAGSSSDLQSVTQMVTVINAPEEQYPYLFGSSQIVTVNQNVHLSSNKSDNEIIAWLRDNGKLAAGDVYTVVSSVSDADLLSLRRVPMPLDSSGLPGQNTTSSSTLFDPAIVQTYTQLPESLDPAIKALALTITSRASNMYDKVSALETYLRDHYIYDTNITAPPAGVEATGWFLFQEKRGYCNYFATAMALLARELGIPARVAVGYTGGKFDSKLGQWVIKGTDAHAWTQVYFAGYGWVNFEPSQSFSLFSHPLLPSNSSSTGANSMGAATPNQSVKPQLPILAGANSASDSSSSDINTQLRQDVGIVLLALAVFLLGGLFYFGLWWRRLFRGLSLPSQIYGRVCTLANWAGLPTKRSQTPHEYMQIISLIAPEEAVIFERLGDIYARERWADPESVEHPAHSGEIAEVPGLWKAIQPRLLVYVLRHPHFFRLTAGRIRSIRQFASRSSPRKMTPVVVKEKPKLPGHAPFL